MRHTTLYFTSIFFTALVLVPGLSHLSSLFNKVELPEQEYFIAQKAYQGWSLWAVALICAMISVIAQTILVRRSKKLFRLSLIALVCLVISQMIFWVFTYPANVKTENWTTMPPNWMELRDNWEYSHAAGAVLNVIAFITITLSGLKAKYV